MRRYFLERIVLLMVTLWGITFVSFMMLQIAPGSPLEMKLGRGTDGSLADNSALNEEARRLLEEQYHLDKPFLVRYGLWLKDLSRLDFGRSFMDQRPVIEKIRERLPVSLTLGISSVIIAIFFAIPLGVLMGALKGTWFDRVSTALTIAIDSIPSYVLGLLLLTFLASPEFLDLFPIYGIQSDQYEQLSWIGRFLDRAYHFTLPVICYSLGIAFIVQQQRSAFLENLQQDYVRTARAKGVSEPRVLFRHVFRNSLIPTVTTLGAFAPAILGGSIIIEQIFSIPGLGLLSYEALFQRDYPVIMANFTIFSFLSLLGVLISDLLYVVVDPRIDFEAQSV